MKTLLLLAALLVAAPAAAQIHVDIHIPLPVAPPLVVVQPGVEVVEGFGDEVFFSNGWFWMRRGPAWYRAPSPRASFVWVEPRAVPAPLLRLPPGQYRHYRADERAERRAWKREAKEDRQYWKEREREDRHREHEDRKARHEWEKEQRKGGHGRGHPDHDD